MIFKKILSSDINRAFQIYCDSFEKDIESYDFKNVDNLYGVYLDELIGFCQVDCIFNDFENTSFAFINSVCVDKNYRNKGAATFLLSNLFEKLKKDNISSIMLTSSSKRVAAKGLYEKLGFYVYDTNVYKKELN